MSACILQTAPGTIVLFPVAFTSHLNIGGVTDRQVSMLVRSFVRSFVRLVCLVVGSLGWLVDCRAISGGR